MAEYLPVQYPPAGGWVLTLMTRLNGSSSLILRSRMANWDKLSPGAESSLGDLALSVASKMAVLPFVVRRLDRRLMTLNEHLKDEARIIQCLSQGAAYKVRDDELVWELLLDVYCFFFEIQSTIDILDRFLVRFCRSLLKRNVKGGAVPRELAERCGDGEWLEVLCMGRDLFIHGAAPWIAFEVLGRLPFRFELLVVKRNDEDLSDRTTHFHINQCRVIHAGLMSSFEQLHEWAIEQIADFERCESHT